MLIALLHDAVSACLRQPLSLLGEVRDLNLIKATNKI